MRLPWSRAALLAVGLACGAPVGCATTGGPDIFDDVENACGLAGGCVALMVVGSIYVCGFCVGYTFGDDDPPEDAAAAPDAAVAPRAIGDGGAHAF